MPRANDMSPSRLCDCVDHCKCVLAPGERCKIADTLLPRSVSRKPQVRIFHPANKNGRTAHYPEFDLIAKDGSAWLIGSARYPLSELAKRFPATLERMSRYEETL